MSDKVLIIGDGPLRPSIEAQYRSRGAEIDNAMPEGKLPAYSEIAVISASGSDDGAALRLLDELAARLPAGAYPLVHLQLQNPDSLWMLQQLDFSDAVNAAMEVNPFTAQDAWAKRVFVNLPGIDAGGYPPLDHRPVSADSRERVRLVLVGFDSYAEALAIHAALIAHFPNYRSADAAPLRTRIVVIDPDAGAQRDALAGRYGHLFDHSFCRTVRPDAAESDTRRPAFEGRRADMVDVEWEFVEARASHPVVAKRLAAWADDESLVLTVAVNGPSDRSNLTTAMTLPEAVYDRRVPVLVRQSADTFAEPLRRHFRYGAVYPYGMADGGYDISLPLVRMAKLLKYFYDCSFGKRGVPTDLPPAEVEAAWRGEHSLKLRMSNIFHVMTIASKMRSLGHGGDADADAFYALNAREVEALAATEHNRWTVERLIMGNRPCTDGEREKIRANIDAIIAGKSEHDLKRDFKRRGVHYDLCAYDELGLDATGRNVKVYDYDLTASLPLIVKSFYEQTRQK